MNDKHDEILEVYIRYKHGQTVCICLKQNKGCCRGDCVEDTVTRERYADWEKTINNRYGK